MHNDPVMAKGMLNMLQIKQGTGAFVFVKRVCVWGGVGGLPVVIYWLNQRAFPRAGK